MAGLGGTPAFCTYVPSNSGKVQVILSGLVNNGTADVGITIQGRYGTGTPPTPTAAATGTAFGRAQRTKQSGNTQFATFITHAVISSLNVGVTYWFDVSLVCAAAGAATIEDVNFTIHEI